MPFIYKGIEYHIGIISTRFTISIPAIKNYFKEVNSKEVDYAHNLAKNIIEDEINRQNKHNSRR